jgi:hypothetical protein
MYKGRLRAVYEPMFLQKHPPLGQATRLPSSRERTTGARAPRPLSPASAPLHAQSTTKVDPVRYQSWRIDPSARGSKDRATAGWRGSRDGATADARESNNRRRGGGASRPAAPAKELTCRVLASQRGSRGQPRTTALMGGDRPSVCRSRRACRGARWPSAAAVGSAAAGCWALAPWNFTVASSMALV